MANTRTPELLASYPHVHKPVINKKKKEKNPDVGPEFSISGLFTQEAYDSPEGRAMRDELERACCEKWGAATFKTMLAEDKFDSPFRKDVSGKGYPEGIVRYISCSSGAEYPPTVVSIYQEVKDGVPQVNAAGRPIPARITDSREFYPGVKVRLGVQLRLYGGGTTGIKAGGKWDLRSVQKTGDGPRFAGGGAADPNEDFGDAQPPPKPADLGSLLD